MNDYIVKYTKSLYLSLVHTYSTLCPKKKATWCLIITLANVDRFSKLFHQLIREKILYVHTQRCPRYLRHVAILPCESRKSKNVTDFDSILTFWNLSDLESTAERCSVERCCNMVIFSPRLSSHCLCSCYAILHVLYTYLSKIISAKFRGRLHKISQ